MKNVCKRAQWIAGVVLLASVGCSVGSEQVTEPSMSLTKLPWKLTLNHHAIVTTKNTPIQLTYEVTNVYGDRLTDLPPIVFKVSDTSVKVDGSGKLTVSTASPLRYVWASVSDPEQSWTVSDTIRIAIEDAVYTFDKFKMALRPDSVVPANRSPDFTARVFDANGDTIRTQSGSARAPISYYVSTAPNNVFSQGNRWTTSLTPRNIGETTVYATSYIFGKNYYDTIRIRSILPDSVVITVHRLSTSLNPSPSLISQPNITILRNGKVNFRNSNTTASTDIVFTDQAAVIGGNIPSVPTTPGAIVVFPNAGKFTYKSTALGPDFLGTITVVER